MNHSTDPLFDRRIAAWLEEDPSRAPDQALETVLAAIPSIAQRRRLPVPWRSSFMTNSVRAAAAVTIVAILGVGVIAFNASSPGVGGNPTPSPAAPSVTGSPAQSDAPAATAGVFSSIRYGYTVGLPGGIHSLPSAQDWPPGSVAYPSSTFLDSFSGALEGQGSESAKTYLAGIAAQPLPVGMSGEEWIDGHLQRNLAQFGEACGGRSEDWVTTEVAGVPGRQVQTDCGSGSASVTEIVFYAEGTGWIITGDTPLVECCGHH